MVVGLRYADDARHTAADPRRPAPAPVIIMPGGCGFSGSEAHPLSAPVRKAAAAVARTGEGEGRRAAFPAGSGTRGGSTGADEGRARRSDMDMVAAGTGGVGAWWWPAGWLSSGRRSWLDCFGVPEGTGL